MRGNVFLAFLIAVVAAFIAMDNHNDPPLVITMGPLIIEATLGVVLIGTFGFGILTGMLTVVPRQYQRYRERRGASA